MANHPVPSNIENSMQILGKYDQKISIPKKVLGCICIPVPKICIEFC